MTGVEPVKKAGYWECPICGFKAISRKVVENHIQRSHSELIQQKSPTDERAKSNRKNAENGKKGGKWQSFKVGGIKIKVLKRPEVEIKDQRGWQFFLTANYIASLHKRRVKVKLITGEAFEGILKAKDPYFVGLVLDDQRTLYINKAHVIWVLPLREQGT